jgi:hypothetical protein
VKRNLSNFARYVLITQQIEQQEYSTYFGNNFYKLVFSGNGNMYRNQRVLPLLNQCGTPIAYFVDIVI